MLSAGIYQVKLHEIVNIWSKNNNRTVFNLTEMKNAVPSIMISQFNKRNLWVNKITHRGLLEDLLKEALKLILKGSEEEPGEEGTWGRRSFLGRKCPQSVCSLGSNGKNWVLTGEKGSNHRAFYAIRFLLWATGKCSMIMSKRMRGKSSF